MPNVAQSAVAAVGYALALAMHEGWIVLAILALRLVLVCGTVVVLAFSVERSERATVVVALAKSLSRLFPRIARGHRSGR